ncbi:MAG: maleylpyruvate isomerase family mycothiol-dependent enzyme [Acidimicrobiales bacterium]
MEPAAALGIIARDGHRLIEVSAANLHAPVPSCPGWTVGQLLGHTSRIHRRVSEHVVRRATERLPDDIIPAVPAGDAVLGYAEAALARLLDALRDLDPTEPMWTWSHQRDGAFFVRRMLHETALHRWDAEAATGYAEPIPGDQGADGIDELYDIVLPFSLTHRPRDLPVGSLHLHRTDGDGEWMLTTTDDSISLARTHAKGDAAVRGGGGDLFLVVWGRRPIDGLELFGDPEVAQAWVGLAP